MSDQDQVKIIENPNFLQKEDWNKYLNEDDGTEHVGYVLATWGVVQELSRILNIEEEGSLKIAVKNLLENRLEMLAFAQKSMDAHLKINSRSVHP